MLAAFSSENLITVPEAAKLLHRSIEQVRRYLREGKLPGRRIGQQWFIPREAVEMKSQKSTTVYEQRMTLLNEIREARPGYAASSGTMPTGAETLEQVRGERDAELERDMP